MGAFRVDVGADTAYPICSIDVSYALITCIAFESLKASLCFGALVCIVRELGKTLPAVFDRAATTVDVEERVVEKPYTSQAEDE